MKGFKILVNDREKVLAVGRGVVIITASHQYGIDMTGTDDEQGISLDWGRLPVDIGDRITITPIESKVSAPPAHTRQSDRAELYKTYLELKEMLKHKGLLDESDRTKV